MAPHIHFDPRLIEQAQRQVQSQSRAVARLARGDVPSAEFFDELLMRLVDALAAKAAAVWLARDDGRLMLQRQCDPQQSEYTAEPAWRTVRGKLALRAFTAGQPRLIAGDDEAFPAVDNVRPEGLLLLAPIVVEGQTRGVLEVLQRPGADEKTTRGYQRFVEELAECAADYLFRNDARRLAALAQRAGQIDALVQAVHAGLDPVTTAGALANEGRRLIDCDRASVLLWQGGRAVLAAVSGVERVERRGNLARLLEQLAAAVVRMNEPLWFEGQSDQLPPQVERVLNLYLDETHARSLAIIPLRVESRLGAKSQPLGALVCENLGQARNRASWESLVMLVAGHGQTALANACEHTSLFLLPLWRALGQLRWIVAARTLPKTISAVVALLAVALALLFVPYELTVASRGTLQPVVRRDVFAPHEGVVQRVHVNTADQVACGDVLAELRNVNLEVQITALAGQRMASEEQLASIERAIFDEGRRLSADDQTRLQGDRAELRQKLLNIDQQLALLKHKQEQLVVRSPIAGQVTTWNVVELLDHRPVTPGQVLMTVVDPADAWEVELRIPEDRMGHVALAQQAHGEPLTVSFLLATDPGREIRGTIKSVHRAAEVRGDEGSVVLVKVAVDRQELPHLRPGADVRAKVHCGRRALGYVLFHDLIEFVQSRILFAL